MMNLTRLVYACCAEWLPFHVQKRLFKSEAMLYARGVGVEVVVEWVVAVLGIEADFDVILGPLVTLKDVFYLCGKKSPLTSKINPPMRFSFVGGFVGQNLLRERKHAAGCFCHCQ